SYSIEELGIKFDEDIINKIKINKQEPTEVIQILNNFFSNLCSKIKDQEIVEEIKKLMQSSNLNNFYNEIDLSIRQVQRETKKFTGLTPQTIQRILRFYKILDNLRTFDDINFSSLAQKLDFYDQSHLIKEFKYFSGINLKNFLFTKNEYLQFQSEEYCHHLLSNI
ncbi:helix-turn-helix domain-containing protein, partial [Arcobacter sp. CECT 8985]|uniref:helix-turn-helix domain-containing protein n=1 Tax=Arcobacter sp. CECT 8985 TaxID=1935424 RepID=UPI0010270701